MRLSQRNIVFGPFWLTSFPKNYKIYLFTIYCVCMWDTRPDKEKQKVGNVPVLCCAILHHCLDQKIVCVSLVCNTLVIIFHMLSMQGSDVHLKWKNITVLTFHCQIMYALCKDGLLDLLMLRKETFLNLECA